MTLYTSGRRRHAPSLLHMRRLLLHKICRSAAGRWRGRGKADALPPTASAPPPPTSLGLSPPPHFPFSAPFRLVPHYFPHGGKITRAAARYAASFRMSPHVIPRQSPRLRANSATFSPAPFLRGRFARFRFRRRRRPTCSILAPIYADTMFMPLQELKRACAAGSACVIRRDFSRRRQNTGSGAGSRAIISARYFGRLYTPGSLRCHVGFAIARHGSHYMAYRFPAFWLLPSKMPVTAG